MIHYDPGGEQLGPTPSYSVVELEDTHYLGEQGLPVHHQTGQMVEALEPLSALRVTLDASATSIEMVHGGQVISVVKDMPGGLYRVDIALEKRLRTGERTFIEWFTHLRHETAPPLFFRRAIGSQALESLSICVVFDGRKLPTQVSWAEWQEDTDVSPQIEEADELNRIENGEPDPPMTAYRKLAMVRNRSVGFRWQWRPLASA